MGDTLVIAERFLSLQGEGLYSGIPCYFIRTAGCDIRCNWCDTEDAFQGGTSVSLEELLREIPREVRLVQITGGEPLVQRNSVLRLMERLVEEPHKKKVLLETGGHRSIDGIPDHVHICMDIKLPGSGEEHHDFIRNLPFLKKSDEIKFVLADEEDYRVASRMVRDLELDGVCTVLFSPVRGQLDLRLLAENIVRDRLPVRLQIQLHKSIWGENARGV